MKCLWIGKKRIMKYPALPDTLIKCINVEWHTWPETLWCTVSVWCAQWSHIDSVCNHTWGICTCTQDTKREWHKNKKQNHTMWVKQSVLPCVSCPVMWHVFDPVRHRVHFTIFHDHLHSKSGFPFCKHALPHPVKQNQRLIHGSLSPGGGRDVVTLELLSTLVAHIRMTPYTQTNKQKGINSQ